VLRLSILAALALVLGSPAAFAPPPEAKDDPSAPSTEPKGLPIELKIVNESLEAYDLDSRGVPPYKFQERLREAAKTGELPFPTRVEMQLEIKNTGTSTIKVWVAGDATLLTLDLKGNGAMVFDRRLPRPNSVKPPVEVTIGPGKSHKIPLTEFAYGLRNQAIYAYITETGLYHLTATFKTAVAPAPGGTKEPKAGWGEVILKSAPLTFRVVRPS
jgi:hypothetical protein